jgi:hypothetical protein
MICSQCGSSYDPRNRLCPTCGTPRPLYKEDFISAEREVSALFSALSLHKISLTAYREGIRGYVLPDADGSWWSFDPNVRYWLRFDGREWKKAEPTYLVNAPAIPQPVSATRSVGWKRWRGWVIGLGVFLLLGYSAAAWFLGGARELLMLPQMLTRSLDQEQRVEFVFLSAAQDEIRSLHGNPDAFDILFYQEEQEDGTIVDIRSESWRYYSIGLEYSFINGEKVGEDVIELPQGVSSFSPCGYVPEQFTANMTPDALAEIARVEEFLLVPLDDALLENGRLYYAPQLSWGFKGNQLAFVHALAVTGEENP